MSIEIDTQLMIMSGYTKEQKADQICKISNFNRDAVIKALSEVSKDVSDAYEKIVKYDKATRKSSTQD